jgi:preprotein translocase subunit SecG
LTSQLIKTIKNYTIMKKVIAVLAVALFTFSMNVTAQEKKTSGPAKKEATTTKKAACSTEEKKACSTGEKKACCAHKKA